MTTPAALAEDIRPRVIGALRLRRVQVALAIIFALVVVALTVVDARVWEAPWLWVATGGMAVATVLALASRHRAGLTMRVLVPALDLAALAALIADGQAPRIVALLAVVPAFWLAVTDRRRGIVLVGVASAALLVNMALRATESTGVTLTANAVGAVLVPLALVATSLFAFSYSRTIERQQLAILQREREKLAIAKQREADATLLDAIFESARVGLLLLDADGGILRTNATLTQHAPLAGERPEHVLESATFLELETRRQIPSHETPFARGARGEAFDNAVVWVTRPGFDQFAVTVSSRPLLIDGEFRGSIISVDDVTTYMRMLEDRDDFVALVSHELRTPLTSIAGFLELVLDEQLDDPLRSWLLIVQRNADRLRALVDDLLVVGEMSRGELRLARSAVDLRALAQEVVMTLDQRARRRGVRLRLVDGPAVMIDADPRRITQVIENLISNGIKYTSEDGTVHVHVDVEGADARLRVSDDGPGIGQAESLRVFERFYRSSSARASGVQGAGLGLWICRMIVEEHDGTIGFDSEPGRGSTAWVRLRVSA